MRHQGSRAVQTLAVLSLTLWTTCGDGDGSAGPAPDESVEFTDLRAERITATSAMVRFNTSRLTTCEAQYGVVESALDRVSTDPMMGTARALEHNVPLEGLAPGTTYYYRARATDEEGDTFLSDLGQFTTLSLDEIPEPGSLVDPAGLVNVATLASGSSVISVSSNFGGGSIASVWGANSAFDGDMASEWATNGDGDDAFIEVDFGRERTITRFGFRSRKMADGSSVITSLRLLISTDAASTALVKGPFETPDPDQTYLYDFAAPVTARRIRLEAVTTTGGNTGAKEIQFFGPVD